MEVEGKEEARVVEEGGEVAKGHMLTTQVAATTTMLPREVEEEGVDHSLMGNIEDEEGGTRHT